MTIARTLQYIAIAFFIAGLVCEVLGSRGMKSFGLERPSKLQLVGYLLWGGGILLMIASRRME